MQMHTYFIGWRLKLQLQVTSSCAKTYSPYMEFQAKVDCDMYFLYSAVMSSLRDYSEVTKRLFINQSRVTVRSLGEFSALLFCGDLTKTIYIFYILHHIHSGWTLQIDFAPAVHLKPWPTYHVISWRRIHVSVTLYCIIWMQTLFVSLPYLELNCSLFSLMLYHFSFNENQSSSQICSHYRSSQCVRRCPKLTTWQREIYSLFN